jgi:hypothetical protein
MKSHKCFASQWAGFSAVAFILTGLVSPALAGTISGTTRLLNGNPRPGVVIQAFEVNIDGRLNESVDLLGGTGLSNETTTPGQFTITIPDGFDRVVLKFIAKDGQSKTVYLPERPLPGSPFGGAVYITGSTEIKNLDVVVPNLDPPAYYYYYYPCQTHAHHFRFFKR